MHDPCHDIYKIKIVLSVNTKSGVVRKSVQILITVIWLTGTIGFSMNKHYCDNVLQQISFYIDSGSCNDSESMPAGDCADQTVYFVIDSSFNIEKYVSEIGITDNHLTLIEDYIHTTTLTSIYQIPFKEIDFPLLNHPRIYTEIQSFLL